MKLEECEKKYIRVYCTDDIVINGRCSQFLNTEEAEAEELRGPCIYIESGEHGLIEIFEDEILRIEPLK